MKILVKSSLSPLSAATLERAAHVLLLLPPDLRNVNVPQAAALRAQFARQRNTDTDMIVCDLPTSAATRTVAVRVKPDIASFELLTLARKAIAQLLNQNPATIDVSCFGLQSALAARALEAAVSATLAAVHVLPSFKSKPAAPPALRTLVIHHPRKLDFARTLAQAEGNNLARELSVLPPNELTPARYRARIAALAREHGWAMKFLGERELKKLGAGAFLAVAQGSAERDAGIMRLRYTPKRGGKTAGAGLALVGKGICFDTGGMNLKPARHMHGMHEDMAGSAVALGTLLALTQLRVDFPVDCWLALAQNHIGPHAYKQNDVVKAANGTTIEIVHTDAEGRMVLADTLHFASRDKPGLLIDYATLTGSCIAALGTSYSGIFTTDEALMNSAVAAGKSSGERVWPFPLDTDFDAHLDSAVADIKQCTLDNEADHILAARFLARFVAKDTRWLHVDLSAINHKGGLAHIPTDSTGFGVRFTLDLLLDKNALTAGE